MSRAYEAQNMPECRVFVADGAWICRLVAVTLSSSTLPASLSGCHTIEAFVRQFPTCLAGGGVMGFELRDLDSPD